MNAMVSRNDTSLPRFRLNARQLALLIQLAEQRSVVRAAEALHITQPAASKLLATLEDSLGVSLFQRHKRGVEPTWYGEIMVRHARAALTTLGQAQEEIVALRSGHAGRASVGTVVNPATNLVPLAIANLKRKHPRILVRVEMDLSNVLLEWLVAGKLDIAIARIGDTDTAGVLRFESLAAESHIIVGRAGHPLKRRHRLTLKELEDQSWILPPKGRILRQRLDGVFAGNGLRAPHNIVEATSLPVVTSLLQTTNMIAALQEEIIYPYRKAGLLTPLPVRVDVSM